MTIDTAPSLRALAVKSAAWYGTTRLWGQVLSWGVTIFLARMLAPGDYGLFAIALSILAMLEILQEFGLGTAIVQRQDLTRQQLNSVFFIVTATSLLLTGATFLAGESISRFYAEPRLTWTLRILSLTFLLNSLGMVPYSLLTKSLDLRRRSLAEAVGAAASALVALVVAYMGYGVWALVLGHLARAVVLNGGLAIYAGWWPGRDLQRDGLRSLMTFSLRIAGMHVVGNSSAAITTFIMARALSGTAVGLYAMAQGFAEAPHRISTAVINQISFPIFSRLQDQREELAKYFLSISRCLAIISLPIQVGLVLVGPDLVAVLLSSKWDEMVLPFQIVCLESAVVVLTLTSSPLLTAVGRADLLFKRSFVSVGAMAAATLVGVQFGLVGITAARLIAMVPLRLSLLLPSLSELRLPVGAYVGPLVRPLLSVGVMAAMILIVQHVIYPEGSPIVRLVASIVVGAVTYLGTLLLADRRLGGEVQTITRDLFSRSLS